MAADNDVAMTTTVTTTEAGIGAHASEAVSRARAATVGVHDARAAMIRFAGERQQACLAAHEAGVSIRRLATELGLSPGAVQRVVETARARRVPGT